MSGNKLEEYTIAVIGAGRIGQAILRGLKPCGPKLIGTGRRRETLLAVEEIGAKPLLDNRRAGEEADIIIVSVKPYQFPEIIADLAPTTKGKPLISVVAGVTTRTLMEAFPGAHIMRAMPNINALIGKSTTAITPAPSTPEETIQLTKKIFECLGTVYSIPEEWIDAWTALIGSSPAFLTEIIDGLTLGAVMTGMPRELAYKALLDAMKATIEHLTLAPIHPLQLRDEVTTPAGTTIHGLRILEARGVKAGLMEVIEKSATRGAELAHQIDENIRRELTQK